MMSADEHVKPASKSASRELRRLWSEWTGIVEDVAHRRRHAYRLTDRGYAELHTRLVAAIQQQVDRCKSAKRTLVREMLGLAAPWSSLASLADAERHMLAVLLTQCRRLDKRLHYRVHRRRWMMVAVPILLAVVTGIVFTLAAQFWNGADVSHTIRNLQHEAYRFERAIVGASFMTKTAVLAVIVIASGAFFLRKMRED